MSNIIRLNKCPSGFGLGFIDIDKVNFAKTISGEVDYDEKYVVELIMDGVMGYVFFDTLKEADNFVEQIYSMKAPTTFSCREIK